jgi:CHAT domain-containing protein/Tfp pilus assembly protein PilF
MAFGIIVLIAGCSIPEACTLTSGQEVESEGNAALNEGIRLRHEAQKLDAAGKLAEAVAALEAMLAIERKILPAGHDGLASSLEWVAALYVQLEDFAAAKTARQEALTSLRKHHGESHWKVADARRALEDIDRRAELPREQRRRLAQADRLDQDVVALYLAGKYGEAFNKARRVLRQREEIQGQTQPTYANSLRNLASLLFVQGDLTGTRRLLEQALAIYKETLGERHPRYANCVNDLAVLRKQQGDYAGARPLYELALTIVREALGEHHPDYATAVHNLATLLKTQGDYARARPLYELALAIRKEVQGERHPDYATGLSNLGGLLLAQGDYVGAMPLYEQALAIRKDVHGEHHPAYAEELQNLAALLQTKRDYTGARPLYERALAIQKEMHGEHRASYGVTLNNLAALLCLQGDYDAARPLIEQALAVRKEVVGDRHPNYAESLCNLAALLDLQGNLAAVRPLIEQALTVYKEVLGEHHPDYARCLRNLAMAHWTERNYPEAARLLERGLDISRHNLDLAAAGQSERQQLAMAHAHRGMLDALLSLAPVAEISADSVYRHVLITKGAVFERQRRMRAQRYRYQADSQSQAAQRFAEYEQTVCQVATLALATVDPTQAPAWRKRVAELSRRKDELEAELARFDSGFHATLTEAIRKPEQLGSALPHGTALIDLLEYTAFVPPAQGKGKFEREPHLVAFVVRPDQPIARVDLGPLEPIRRAIEDWRPALTGHRPPATGNHAARALRQLIWEPVEPHLDGIVSVLFSPDGPVGLVPLAALPGKDSNLYLIEERSLAVVPVARLLDSAASPSPRLSYGAGRAPAASLLLVGDVDYGGNPGHNVAVGMSRSAAVGTRSGLLPDFPGLPATGDEIASISRYFRSRFRGEHALELDGAQATEAAVRQDAPRHRFVHIATHGYFAPKELRSALGPEKSKQAQSAIDALGGVGIAGYHPGLLSGIALAGANHRPTPVGLDDGILTALEVAELDLSGVELAVLSACETGLGEVAGGEGLLGLQRAFQVAGARSVVASLWTVRDEPTRALMARFYENLWRNGQPPAAALREAQLYVLREGRGRGLVPLGNGQAAEPAGRPPPHYWAAFVFSTDRP